HAWLEPTLTGFIGHILANLGLRVYHWGIDNYGDASTPVFIAQIEAFQGHHKWPRTITQRQFAK
ncbi:Fatty acid desaturase 4, chloroplastic, partial [Ancistrocladus abbreviatus]